jgi:hemerythrin
MLHARLTAAENICVSIFFFDGQHKKFSEIKNKKIEQVNWMRKTNKLSNIASTIIETIIKHYLRRPHGVKQ